MEINPTKYIDLSSTIFSYKLGKDTPMGPKETGCFEQYAEYVIQVCCFRHPQLHHF